MIKTILLDLDGVCNRFQLFVFQTLGLPFENESQYPVECGWDIVKAANHLAGEERWSTTKFWNAIDRSVWANVPVSEFFGYLLGTSESLVGKENIHFLTSPTLDPECMAGKLEWIHSYAPKWMQRQFLVGPSKHLCAQPGVVLIDDADKNVEAFNKHGGRGILLPRPWNSLHGTDAWAHLAKEFQHLEYQTWPKSLTVASSSN